MRIPVPTRFQSILLAIGFATAAAAPAAFAAEANTPGDAEAVYTKVIDARVTKIVAPLNLEDPAKSEKVHGLIAAQYRALRDRHEANDARGKKASGDELTEINTSLTALHDQFLAGLSVELTPKQLEQVKDGMTYGKVQFTYAGYVAEYPELTEEQKQKVLEYLKEARELAMDGGSSEEKTAIFNRYKGKINNWLSAQGVVIGKKKNAAAAAATNTPAGNR